MYMYLCFPFLACLVFLFFYAVDGVFRERGFELLAVPVAVVIVIVYIVGNYIYQKDELKDWLRIVGGIITIHTCITSTVEPLYCGHHWGPSNCPDCRGVLNSGVVLYRITATGKPESVHIREVSTVRGSTAL